MLPSADRYLQHGGFSPQSAAYTLIGCFLGGVVAIQCFSGLLHHYIPTHVVGCDHTHSIEDKACTGEGERSGDGHHRRPHHAQRQHDHTHLHHNPEPLRSPTETTALLPRHTSSHHHQTLPEPNHINRCPNQDEEPVVPPRRPSFQFRLPTSVSSLVNAVNPSCDGSGPCFGFSGPCGQQCFNHLRQQNEILRSASSLDNIAGQPKLSRSATVPLNFHSPQGPLEGLSEDAALDFRSQVTVNSDLTHSKPLDRLSRDTSQSWDPEGGSRQGNINETIRRPPFLSTHMHHDTPPHHHHVPTNAFLSIGLQTSIAIALHKLPEGFITFATNHANPQLGFAVFMALFIHSITEGFAMALPLFLALESRWEAMLWSSLLGGLSQPAGAGVAALWFKLAGEGDMEPGEAVYGIMFAVTCEPLSPCPSPTESR
jgi:zinc transporter, ZIP family